MQQPRRVMPEEGSSSATFAYGILVNLHTLVVAAKAFSTFSTDVHTLDLILSRRGRAISIQSTSTPPPRVSLQGLPLEILLLVREHLLGIHLEATPNVFLEQHEGFLDFCQGSDVDWSECECSLDGEIECSCSEETKKARERYKMMSEPSKWDSYLWTLHDECDCDFCANAAWAGKSFHRAGHAGCKAYSCDGCEAFAVQQIRRLLRAYGLSLSTPTYASPHGAEARDFLAAIILPSQVRHLPANIPRRQPNAPHSYHGPVEPNVPEYQNVTTFCPSIFSVTPKDDLKFTRVVRDLRLDVAKPDGSFVSSAKLGAREEKRESEDVGGSGGTTGPAKEGSESDGDVETKVEPVFMLLHSMAPYLF
ncbi:hypothetical protein RQP46_002843 [Phenoliferia psychrophenolica]